jgi:hypothetical protein
MLSSTTIQDALSPFPLHARGTAGLTNQPSPLLLGRQKQPEVAASRTLEW